MVLLPRPPCADLATDQCPSASSLKQTISNHRILGGPRFSRVFSYGDHTNAYYPKQLRGNPRARGQTVRSEKHGDGQSDRPVRIIIGDFEYRWDRLRYDAYRVEEGCDAEPLIRWPFHRIAAVSWLQLRIDPEDIPVIEDVVVVTENEATESEMAKQFFNALSWG